MKPETVTGRGRDIVLLALGLIVATSLTVITQYVVKRGPERLFEQSLRFVLTLGLAYLVYGGWRWARWVTIILVGGTSLVTLTSPSMALVPLGLIYLLCAGLLLSPAAGRFLRHQEALRLASAERARR